jgi:hypothetical protein
VHLTFYQVRIPASQVCYTLRFGEARFTRSQLVLRLFALGNVAKVVYLLRVDIS